MAREKQCFLNASVDFSHCSKGEIRINGKCKGKDMDGLKIPELSWRGTCFLRQWNGYHNLEFLYTIRNKLG